MSFSFPPYRYVPGQSKRHVETVFEAVLAEIEARESASEIARSPAWTFTLELLDKEYYWEAHEVLEAIWMRAVPNSTEAIFLKGLIQIANCGLKQLMDKKTTAKKLQKQARETLELAYRNRPGQKIMNFSLSDALNVLSAHTSN